MGEMIGSSGASMDEGSAGWKRESEGVWQKRNGAWWIRVELLNLNSCTAERIRLTLQCLSSTLVSEQWPLCTMFSVSVKCPKFSLSVSSRSTQSVDHREYAARDSFLSTPSQSLFTLDRQNEGTDF